MRLLDRYIAAHVVVATLLALLALLALFSFIGFVDDLDTVGRRDYTMSTALEGLVLGMPRLAFSLFPVAAVIGSLLGLGVLASQRELIVMRAAGVSVTRLVGAVLKGAAVLIVLAVAIGEGLTPITERAAEERRALALTGQLATGSGFGFWVRDGSSFVNIRRVTADHQMSNVYIYEFDESRRLRVATFAGDASHDGDHWRLESVRQTVLEDRATSVRETGAARWTSVLRPEHVGVVSVRPESLSLAGLGRYIRYLEGNGLDASRFELARWTKLVYPFSSAVMVLLAVPLVLGRVGRAGVGARILIGAVVGVTFHIVNQASGHVGLVYGLSPLVAAGAPTALFALAAAVLAARIR